MVEKITVSSIREWARQANVLPRPPRTAYTEVSFAAALRWAAPHLQKHRDLPVFGSAEWASEPNQQRRTASAVVSALHWALRAEIDTDRRIDAEHQIADAIRATKPTIASSTRYIDRDNAEQPFPYPPDRRAS